MENIVCKKKNHLKLMVLSLEIRSFGMYQFTYEDLFVRPDIYPWLANVYVDEEYRGRGICRKMLESVKENAIQKRLETYLL